MTEDVEKIVEMLTERQCAALLAMPGKRTVRMAYGPVQMREWVKASEIRVSGNTLASMYPLGGVDPETLQAGPVLVTGDLSRQGCHWALTDLGEAVQNRLPG